MLRINRGRQSCLGREGLKPIFFLHLSFYIIELFGITKKIQLKVFSFTYLQYVCLKFNFFGCFWQTNLCKNFGQQFFF